MERTVPQGAKPALAVGNRVPPQVIHTGLEGPGQATKHSFAVLYFAVLYSVGR